MQKSGPDNFQRNPIVPCKGLADFVCDVAKNLLLDECEKNNGNLSSKQIELLFQKLETAPGDLNDLYSRNYNACSAAVVGSFKNSVKLSTSFQRELKEIVGDKAKSFEVGHLQSIGLNNIKKTLGPKWHQISEKIMEISDKCIRDRLTTKDTFVRGKDSDYIICFAELNGEEALFKAKAIESDIIQIVLGEDAQKEFEQLNLDANEISQLTMLTTKSHEIEIEPAEINNGNIYDTLLTKVRSKASKYAVDVKKILKSISKEGFIVPTQKISLSSKKTANAIACWDDKSEAVIQRAGESLFVDHENLLNLDCINLLASAKYLYENTPSLDFVLTVNIHHATISNKKSASAFLGICNSLNPEIRKHLSFNVISTVYEGKGEELLNNCNVLLHFCSFISVQFKTPSYPINDILGTDFNTIIFDFRDYILAMRTLRPKMIDMIKYLSAHGTFFIINNVPHNLTKSILKQSGVNFVYTARS